jgi:hypothetical protein
VSRTSRDTQIPKQQQNFIESERVSGSRKVRTPRKGGAGSEQGGLGSAPVAQVNQCLGLEGYLSTRRGQQGVGGDLGDVRSGFW